MNKYLAIIPARGGSKRLPRKNILKLCGKPLISWSIESGLKSKYINKVLVTSEDEDILEISKKAGANILRRPKELATDTISSYDAVEHAIKNCENYEYVVLLQPTSPLRNENHIDEAIQLLEEKNADAIISICEVEHSPLWTNILPANNSMKDFISEGIKSTRSQDLPNYFRLNGAVYICKTELLLKQKTFFINENIFAYKMKQENSVDIDSRLDFIIAQTILGEKLYEL